MPELKLIPINPSFLIRGSKIKAKYKALLLLFKTLVFGQYFRSLAIPLSIASLKALSY